MQCLRNIQRSFTKGITFCQFSSKSIDVNRLRVELTKEFQNVGIERRESLLSAEYIIAHVLGKKMVSHPKFVSLIKLYLNESRFNTLKSI